MTAHSKLPEADEKKLNREKMREFRKNRKDTHADMRFYLLKETKNRLNDLAKQAKMNQTEVLEYLINAAFENSPFTEEE
ncbi:hypothetical protein ACQUXI_003959 [Cronobacter turicensis]|nr:hypothetical protein [Klebsiella pneumoniae]